MNIILDMPDFSLTTYTRRNHGEIWSSGVPSNEGFQALPRPQPKPLAHQISDASANPAVRLNVRGKI